MKMSSWRATDHDVHTEATKTINPKSCCTDVSVLKYVDVFVNQISKSAGRERLSVEEMMLVASSTLSAVCDFERLSRGDTYIEHVNVMNIGCEKKPIFVAFVEDSDTDVSDHDENETILSRFCSYCKSFVETVYLFTLQNYDVSLDEMTMLKGEDNTSPAKRGELQAIRLLSQKLSRSEILMSWTYVNTVMRLAEEGMK